MYAPNLWNIINIHGNKIALVLVLLFSISNASAQIGEREKQINNPNYDNRFVSYGFLLALHTSNYKLEYSTAFAMAQENDGDLGDIHSIQPRWSTGFNLGFIVNFRLDEQVDLRLTPQVSFYERHLDYRLTSQRDSLKVEQIIESTLVEFPLLLKYKSERRGNTRVYLIGGLKAGIEVSGKNKIESANKTLDIREGDLTLEMGLGLDLYFELFKFSPEIRYSRGLTNMHRSIDTIYSRSLRELNTNTITLYLLFQ